MKTKNHQSFGAAPGTPTPNLDPGDAGYVGASTFVEPVKTELGIGAVVLLAIAAWMFFGKKR